MNKFSIQSSQAFLDREIQGYYHSDYRSGGNWQQAGTIENMIWTLKNDRSPFPDRLSNAQEQLKQILLADLNAISRDVNGKRLMVCVVPRAKKENVYMPNQLYFKKVVGEVVNRLSSKFINGIECIKRHANTKTTHLYGMQGGDGPSPYPGITKDTCNISPILKGQNILLIDDVYTYGKNIDEDAIQALLDNGANSVMFYSIGKTIYRNANNQRIEVQHSSSDDLPF